MFPGIRRDARRRIARRRKSDDACARNCSADHGIVGFG
jgi:hypothetical protein